MKRVRKPSSQPSLSNLRIQKKRTKTTGNTTRELTHAMPEKSEVVTRERVSVCVSNDENKKRCKNLTLNLNFLSQNSERERNRKEARKREDDHA